MKNQYEDIINLPHHVSPTRPQMPVIDRAAQFAPFAALTGYEAVIRETARLTHGKISLDEDAKSLLDQKLRRLALQLPNCPKAEFTYFLADSRKDGGEYVTVRGRVKKIDGHLRVLHLSDGTRIPIEDILAIETALTESAGENDDITTGW